MSNTQTVQILIDTIARQDAVIIELTAERDRARSLACRLEQELAHLEGDSHA